MNVFKKISSNILATERKKTSIQVPESAQKLDMKLENCFILFDYEIRGDGLLICKISANKSNSNPNNSKNLQTQMKYCMVKEKLYLKDMWIGKEYCFVDLIFLAENYNETLGYIDCVAEKMFVVDGKKQHYQPFKSK